MKFEKRIKLGDINLDKIQYITPPIISENVIFYSDNDFNIVSKNLETGKLNWKIKLEFEKDENFSLVSGFFLDNNTLFFSTGLGNIYCSEILYDARVSPLRKIGSLNDTEIKNIIKSTKKILKKAISFGGTTIKNFIVSEEKIGYFKNRLKVYSREKKKCLRCLKGIVIKKIKQSGRSTFFCEKCQK